MSPQATPQGSTKNFAVSQTWSESRGMCRCTEAWLSPFSNWHHLKSRMKRLWKSLLLGVPELLHTTGCWREQNSCVNKITAKCTECWAAAKLANSHTSLGAPGLNVSRNQKQQLTAHLEREHSVVVLVSVATHSEWLTHIGQPGIFDEFAVIQSLLHKCMREFNSIEGRED